MHLKAKQYYWKFKLYTNKSVVQVEKKKQKKNRIDQKNVTENLLHVYNCYGTYLTDYNELFLLLWIPGEYSSRC